MGPRAAPHAVDQLRHSERRLGTEHQAQHTGHHRRGKAGAVVVAVAGRLGCLQAQVVQRQQAVVAQQRAPDTFKGRVAADRGHHHRGAEVGVVRLEAVAVQRRHADHTRTTGRALDVAVAIAGCCHHHRAGRCKVVDRLLVGLVAGRTATEADVDDARRVPVQRHALHLEPGGPAHRVDDVGHLGATLAGHTHRQHARAPVDAGHTHAVVGAGADDAGDHRAVPGAALHVAAAEQRGVGVFVGLADAVARVARVGVAAVAVVGDGQVGHKVVARQHLGAKLGVGGDAGVQHRDHGVAAAGAASGAAKSPGRLQARHAAQPVGQRVGAAAARSAQPPLPCRAGRGGEVRIVGHLLALLAVVGHHPFDLGPLAQLLGHALRVNGGERVAKVEQLRRAAHRTQAGLCETGDGKHLAQPFCPHGVLCLQPRLRCLERQGRLRGKAQHPRVPLRGGVTQFDDQASRRHGKHRRPGRRERTRLGPNSRGH